MAFGRGDFAVWAWWSPASMASPRPGFGPPTRRVRSSRLYLHRPGLRIRDWNGVILGDDFIWRQDRWLPNPRASKDPALSNTDPVTFLRLVRNTYRVLLTRRTSGTLQYSTDPEPRHDCANSSPHQPWPSPTRPRRPGTTPEPQQPVRTKSPSVNVLVIPQALASAGGYVGQRELAGVELSVCGTA
ncbi:DNA/RNA helicase domain-containing protein [Streptomyces sp. NPDC006530]|uniref:DNA/RNA helicase domain-containing protein n=1 Tax=Streptomyces sp. NPDC006530 TaxID=3364750 RepID=UPI003683D18A